MPACLTCRQALGVLNCTHFVPGARGAGRSASGLSWRWGQNGRVWVGSADASAAVLVANALGNSERLSPAQAHIMVRTLLASVRA